MATREEWLERVKQEERAIIQAEGLFTIKGRYFAREADATLQRRWEAEVRASRSICIDVLRDRGWPFCAWCDEPIREGEPTVTLAGQTIHDGFCSSEYGQFTDGPAIEDALEEAGERPLC